MQTPFKTNSCYEKPILTVMALRVHGGNVSTAFAETVGLFYNSDTVRPQRTRRVTLLILFLTLLGLGAFTHAYGETVVSIHGGDFHINGKPRGVDSNKSFMKTKPSTNSPYESTSGRYSKHLQCRL